MKIYCKILLICLLLQTSAYAQVYLHDFQKTMTIDNHVMENKTLEKVSDGGYVVATEVGEFGIASHSVFVYHVDANLDMDWSLELDFDNFGLGPVDRFLPFDIIENSNGEFTICGEIIIEGNASHSGGFILHLKEDPLTQYAFDWINIYPRNSGDPTNGPVYSLERIVETSSGYMAIGIGVNTSSNIENVIIGTDPMGNVLWSKVVLPTQYASDNSCVLEDMVKINDSKVAIVGTTNGQQYDDADILVLTIGAKGRLFGSKIYEKDNEQLDPIYTHNETGNAIIYDESLEELLIVGTVTKKLRGVCSESEFRKLLSMSIDPNTLIPNWRNLYEIRINLDNNQSGIKLGDVAYRSDLDGFAITGTSYNTAFSPDIAANAFICRCDASGFATDIRYYANENDQFLHRIEPNDEGSGFVATGFRTIPLKQSWWVESYDNIEDACEEIQESPETITYKTLQYKPAMMEINVVAVSGNCSQPAYTPIEDIICEKIRLRAPIPLRIESFDQATFNIYPTVTNGVVTIESDIEDFNYTLYDLNGSLLLSDNAIAAGLVSIDLSDLSNGVYLLVISDNDGISEPYRIIKN